MDHDVVVTGPYPYFSTPEIFFAECTCGKWSGGKDSEHNLRRRHAEHAKQMEQNEREPAQGTYRSTYERSL